MLISVSGLLLVLQIVPRIVTQESTTEETTERTPDPEEIEVLHNKGSLFILMSLGLSDGGLTFTEIKDKTNLTNGTTQRRLEELQESGWIRMEATTNENNKAVKKYFLSERTNGMIDGFKQLGNKLLQ